MSGLESAGRIDEDAKQGWLSPSSSRGDDEAVTQVRRLTAAPLVVGLDGGETIVAPRRFLDLVAVHPGGVLAEDGALDRAVGRAELGEAMFLAHVLGNLEAA